MQSVTHAVTVDSALEQMRRILSVLSGTPGESGWAVHPAVFPEAIFGESARASLEAVGQKYPDLAGAVRLAIAIHYPRGLAGGGNGGFNGDYCRPGAFSPYIPPAPEYVMPADVRAETGQSGNWDAIDEQADREALALEQLEDWTDSPCTGSARFAISGRFMFGGRMVFVQPGGESAHSIGIAGNWKGSAKRRRDADERVAEGKRGEAWVMNTRADRERHKLQRASRKLDVLAGSLPIGGGADTLRRAIEGARLVISSLMAVA